MSGSILDTLYAVESGQTITLPSGRMAIIREMTGKDQRGFSDKAKVQSGLAMDEMLANCIIALDGADMPLKLEERLVVVRDMLSGDRQVALFMIRKNSLGPTFEFTSKCPNPACGKESQFEVDLSEAEFPVQPYANGQDTHGQFVLELAPSVAAKFKFKFITGHDELVMLRKRRDMNALSDLDMRQLQVWEDAGEGRWVPVSVDKLGKVLSKIRAEIQKQEGSLDSAVEVTCPTCKEEVRFQLMLQPDFLIPTGR